MKKIISVLLLSSMAAFATTGLDVYKNNCASCHAMKGMMSATEKSQMKKKMQNATDEQKSLMRKEMMKKMKESDMKAPAMPMVSMRLKKMTGSKEKFLAFVKDYIVNPSQDKGYCMPMAYKRFGTMPAIGKGLSKKERELVALWLYDNFKGTWGDSMEGKSCDMRNKGSMKCGAGKCGASSKSEKSKMKCGSGKCGSK